MMLLLTVFGSPWDEAIFYGAVVSALSLGTVLVLISCAVEESPCGRTRCCPSAWLHDPQGRLKCDCPCHEREPDRTALTFRPGEPEGGD